jgi:hypothetical protein
MKKIVLTLSIAFFFNSAFALDPAFKPSQAPGSHSNYQSGKTYAAENIVYNAYYNAEGEMVSAFRHILSSDLPMNLIFSLKKYNKNMWVTDVVEVLNENKSTSYFVNLENADEKITLKSKNGNKWKIQKN